jgi:hypothetical protein
LGLDASAVGGGKDRLLDNVIRRIVHSEDNVVTLTVFNHSDDPIIAVEVTPRVPRVGLLVFNTAPSAEPMPGLPKWPAPLDDTLDKVASPHLAAVGKRLCRLTPERSAPEVVTTLSH